MATLHERISLLTTEEIPMKRIDFISRTVQEFYQSLDNPEPYSYIQSTEGQFKVRNYPDSLTPALDKIILECLSKKMFRTETGIRGTHEPAPNKQRKRIPSVRPAYSSKPRSNV